MKKIINVTLLVEAIVCIILSAFGMTTVDTLCSILSFPLKQIGQGLRWLSLSGATGNVVAWGVYVVLCLVPMVIFLLKLVKRKFKPEDMLLPVLSIVLFVVVYFAINISEFTSIMAVSLEVNVALAILGTTVYSVIVGYIILRVVRRFRIIEQGKAKRYLNGLLFAVNVFLVYAVFGDNLSEVIDKLSNLTEINQESEFLTTKVFLWLQYAMDVIVNLMVIGIIVGVQHFVNELDIDNISDAAVRTAGYISKSCVVAIAIHVVMHIVFNLAQIIFVRDLYITNSVVSVPMMLVIAMMIFMVAAQFILEAKKIKEENDMFI